MFKRIFSFVKNKNLEKYEYLIFMASSSFFVTVLYFCYPDIRPYVDKYFKEFLIAIFGGCFTYEQIKIMKSNQEFTKYQYKQQREDKLYDKKIELFYKSRNLFINRILKIGDFFEDMKNQLSEIEMIGSLKTNLLGKKINEISFEIRKIEVEARVLLKSEIYEKFKEATDKLENLFIERTKINQVKYNWLGCGEWKKYKNGKVINVKPEEISENMKKLEEQQQRIENIICDSFNIKKE